MYVADAPPAPVMKMRRGSVGDVRRGPETEAQREWVFMLTRPECEGSVFHGLVV